MNYITTVQAAEKWGISISRIAKMCKAEQIPGAVQIGTRWMIPDTLEKPADGRTRVGKSSKESESFRFPLFLNFSEESYMPPLSEDEALLREAEKHFYACRFDRAKELLLQLCDEEINQYVRLAALLLRCYLAVFSPEEENYDALFYDIHEALEQDFPYREEMYLLRYAFFLDYGFYQPIFENFRVNPTYSYHPSVRYILSLISLIPIEGGDLTILSRIRYDTQELLCQWMERDGYLFEAQQMHFLLLIVYQLKADKEKMRFHIRRGLQIAYEKELYFYPAYYWGFYRDAIQEVLQEFPEEFGEIICTLGDVIHASFADFTLHRQSPSFLGLLSDEEFAYAFLASQGLSNREIARKMHVSVRIVTKINGIIYEKLGVKNKRGLVEIINRTHWGEKK